MIVLETERMVLRRMNSGDVDNLLLIFSDPVAMRYYPSTKGRDGHGGVELRGGRNLGFNRFGLSRLVSLIDPGNEPS
ncbi:MAG TPA: hypothetical protein VGL40_13725 [Bacillota bacterium]|jgi:hypothetical protein